MKLLHLSSRENRDSILKNGLLPSKITLPNHYQSFRQYGLKTDKCVYTWDSDSGQSTDKYVKDMIYCKLFIHPRNKMYDEYYEKMSENLNEEDGLDFTKFGTKLYGKSDIYDLYEIDIEETNSLLLKNTWVHAQMRDDTKFGTCFMMKEEYEHNDKILYISGDTIPPDMLKIVTSVKSRLYKNDTIWLSYSNNI